MTEDSHRLITGAIALGFVALFAAIALLASKWYGERRLRMQEDVQLQPQPQHQLHHQHQQHKQPPCQTVKEKTGQPIIKSGNRKKNLQKSNKNSFEHPMLATNLMGHAGKIMGIDVTSDGKYIVSCGDDDISPEEEHVVALDESKQNRSPSESPSGSVPGSPTSPRRSRRRRKQRKIEFDTQVSVELFPPCPGPLPRFQNLRTNEFDLSTVLSFYLLTPDQLTSLGYPVESAAHPDRAIIYSLDFRHESKEFLPQSIAAVVWSIDEDSGHGSGSDSETGRVGSGRDQKCSRCNKTFQLTPNCQNTVPDRCRYHWGRYVRDSQRLTWGWTCCSSPSDDPGCSVSSVHVWSGKNSGLNGPLEGFVRTKPRKFGSNARRILALDCEMCYTWLGLQVAKVEVIGADGCRVYSHFIKPKLPITDYNTRYSGITYEDIASATKTLEDVQNDMLEMMDEDTILVGHGLENDLRALKLIHGKIVDTAVNFPHEKGLPYRRSLKSLASTHLAHVMQVSKHCPLEDARVSLDLMLWRIHHDFSMYGAPVLV